MRILVVGTGSIGARHALHAARFAEVAVCDMDEGRAVAAARPVGGVVFSDLAEALAWEPHGVVVATPHASHLAVAEAATGAGADVLIEKPIAPTHDGVAEFLGRAAARGRRVFVVCNMRFHPGFDALRAALPKIGRPLFARARYGGFLPEMRPGRDYRAVYSARRAAGGGVVLDAIHLVDYLIWLFGPVVRAGGDAGRLGTLEIDVEDWAELTLHHASGVRSSVHLDFLRRATCRGCEVVGSEGTIVWQSEGKEPEACTVRLDGPGGNRRTLLEAEVDATAMYAKMMEWFVRALAGESTPLATGEDGRRALCAALAARTAGLEGRGMMETNA